MVKKREQIWVDVQFKQNLDKMFPGEELSMTKKTKKLNKVLEVMIYGTVQKK